jgi:hypothetical protein
MTGFKSKRLAGLDEEGMYLVHHTKRKDDDDDDTQVYQRPWVGLTQEEVEQFHNWKDCRWSINELVRHVEATLRIKNT